ncbi:glycosyltransferase family 92 protein RCOM_0530710 [Ricinus communis]|uniref:Glycosyltransferase family 92 protein n=1 Tax=Ricinus communis TaxID=3988 RepID=B9R8P0_RICCO|nr:glycosyltransferase family 92 protein RCOM_0530710 [Ricinus communis]EEF52870.1 conserved hypothetical protein [Ricinus communis]|eukprot:XP_002510683.1 glycosyltransferase family 92 protein RCOM_0530710 [Ricinus communis]
MNTIEKSPSAPLLYLLSIGRSSEGGGGGGDISNITETMRCRASAMVLISFISAFLCVSFSLYFSRNSIYTTQVLYPSPNLVPPNNAIQESIILNLNHPQRVQDSIFTPSVSVLFPDWEVLVIVSPEIHSDFPFLSAHNLTCFYPNNATSPARFSEILPSTNQTTFKCLLPRSSRRRLPFVAPVLMRLLEKELPIPRPLSSPPEEILRWSKLVYESFSAENDVVLFAKGLNNRQGINRSPSELRCVFIHESDNNIIVKTAVTSSIQEVFRCDHPDLTALVSGVEEGEDPIKLKVSLEVLEVKKVMPTVSYYNPWRKIANPETKKSQLCATTMVYNVGKYLREWVMYHSKIGIEKFILYDNDSDDDLSIVVKELNQQGYNVETLLWFWPKTQEAVFSHAALHARDSCKWMMYVDVDEFVFAPSWDNSSQPFDRLLKSLLPSSGEMIGQVSIKCNEFGPSNQKSNPVEGVTQGYNCRRRVENRHKSIVLLEAIHRSLHNVIHHFSLKEEYRTKQLSLERAVVNHYKYQAWSEFKAKFRRRVSAYVVDWMQAMNPESKDRTPGLGYEAIEPPGWENKFCEVRDDRLKFLTQKWFGTQRETGYRMAWQS